MMGQDQPPQRSLFYTGINLEKRVRHGHVLRKVAKVVDFEFVYALGNVWGDQAFNSCES